MKLTYMYLKTVNCMNMFLLAAVIMTAICSCQNREDYPEAQTVDGVSFTITAESVLETRTILPTHDGTEDGVSSGGVQHVTDVYVYVFEQDEDTQDFTCRAMQDVQWSEHISRDENGKLPVTTEAMSYYISYGFQVGKKYRLVAVGLDCAENEEEMPGYDGHNSAMTYGLPYSIGEGSKLSEAVSLLDGRTTDDLAHSELFAGAIDFIPESSSKKNIGVLHLYRRVAGLQVCLTMIPKDVDCVRVMLYNSQNTKVPVIPVNPDFMTSPYGGSPYNEEGRVLINLGTDELERVGFEESTGIYNYYYKCQTTAFLLPMDKPDSDIYDYTLMVEFITTNITGIVGETTRIRLTKPHAGNELVFEEDYDIGTGIIDDMDKYLFPISANHFYILGTPGSPIDCSNVLKQ